MDNSMNRRDWLRTLTASGAAAGLGLSMTPVTAAQNPGEANGFQSSVLNANETQAPRSNPTVENGRVLQPAANCLYSMRRTCWSSGAGRPAFVPRLPPGGPVRR